MKPKNHLNDTIIYTVKTNPGGVDGRDPNDQGGTVVMATFEKLTAEALAKRNGGKVERQIVDNDDLVRAYSKLDPIDHLLIERDMTVRVIPVR